MSSRISIIHFGDLGARAYGCGEGDQASLCSPLFLLIFCSSKEKEGGRKRKKQVGREEIKVWNSPIC